ncbi:hypothetical protein D3C72_1790390 [compost metagenome]
MHADEAGSAGQNGTDEEADRRRRRQQQPGTHEDDDAHDCNGEVLAGEIGLRPFTNITGNFLHAGIALIGGQDRACRPDRIGYRQQTAKYDA